jgi:single-stranded-DNA-specific exonuclease
MKEENVPEFQRRFEEYVAENILPDQTEPQIDIDAFIDFKEITPKFFRLLKQFQPFGPGNMSPVFLTENVYDNGNGRVVGSDAGHLKLELIQEDEPYRPISAIAFYQSEHFDYMQSGNPVDVCYSVAENYYRGIANIQLRIKDIKPREVIL